VHLLPLHHSSRGLLHDPVRPYSLTVFWKPRSLMQSGTHVSSVELGSGHSCTRARQSEGAMQGTTVSLVRTYTGTKQGCSNPACNPLPKPLLRTTGDGEAAVLPLTSIADARDADAGTCHRERRYPALVLVRPGYQLQRRQCMENVISAALASRAPSMELALRMTPPDSLCVLCMPCPAPPPLSATPSNLLR
jgi:hypothetical protein